MKKLIAATLLASTFASAAMANGLPETGSYACVASAKGWDCSEAAVSKAKHEEKVAKAERSLEHVKVARDYNAFSIWLNDGKVSSAVEVHNAARSITEKRAQNAN